MQSVTSRIWTRVAVSISYDDNDYTTGCDEKSFDLVFTSYKNANHLCIISIRLKQEKILPYLT